MSKVFDKLPKTWEVLPLSAFIAHLESGVSVNADDRTVVNDEIGVLSTSCAALGRFMPEEHKAVWPNESKRVRVNPRAGEIIISRMNTPNLVGETGLVKKTEPSLFLPDRLWQTVARVNKETDFRWLNQVLQWEPIRKAVRDVATGTSNSMKNISKGAFLAVQVPTPPINEQRGIADVLTALDEQIEQTEALVVKLTLARSGLYANLRELFPSTVRIGEQFTLSSGTTPLRSKTHFYGRYGTPWVKTLDLNERRLSQTDESVTRSALAACSLRLLPPGTVLVAMYGGWEQIGRTALLDMKGCTNQAITALTPKNAANWNPYFVLKALQALRHKWRDFAVSTRKDPNITKSDIAEFMLPMPPVADQNYWGEKLESADEHILIQKTEVSKLRLQKQGLMHDLLTGATGVI